MARTQKTLSSGEIRLRLAPLFRDEGLRLALLFGSAHTGKLHMRSDIDLAFLFDSPSDILALTGRVASLLRTDRVDVVDLRRSSPLLKFAIVGRCEVLYERPRGAFCEFYSLAFRMYADTRKLREARVEAIESFLEARGLR
jgi:predicted nucleotidyltransferase